MNSTGSKGVLFLPESAFEVLVKRQISSIKPPCFECLHKTCEDLSNIVYVLDIPEFRRFHNLRDAIAEVIKKLIKRSESPTRAMIESILQIELGFVNSNHPDFIDGAEAFRQANERMDQLLPVEDPKVKQEPNKRWFKIMGKEGKAGPASFFEDIRESEKKNFMSSDMRAPDKPSDKQNFETILIKILIESYFNIVKTNICDAIPKIIICFLVNQVTEDINNELVRELYDNKGYFEFLLEEDAGTVVKRKKCAKIAEGLRKGVDILNQTKEFSIN